MEEFGDFKQAIATVLTRQLAWDASACNQFTELAERLGLTPASEEVLEFEHRDSHLRCNRLAPIGPVIANIAEALARVQMAKAHEPDAATDEETNQAILDSYRQVVASTLISGLATLISSGAIQIGAGVSQ